MPRYTKRPVTIDAFRWTGENKHEAIDFVKGAFSIGDDGTLDITTLEGVMTAQPGDWIIRGVKGEYYPCKPDIFEATYEPEFVPGVKFKASMCAPGGPHVGCEHDVPGISPYLIEAAQGEVFEDAAERVKDLPTKDH